MKKIGIKNILCILGNIKINEGGKVKFSPLVYKIFDKCFENYLSLFLEC